MIMDKLGFILIAISVCIVSCSLSVDQFYDGHDPIPSSQTLNSSSNQTSSSTSSSIYYTSTISTETITSTTLETTTTTADTTSSLSYLTTPVYFITNPETGLIEGTAVELLVTLNKPVIGWVEYATSPDFTIGTGNLTSKTTDFRPHLTLIVSELASNTEYFYRIHAEDNLGEAAVSEEYSFHTQHETMLTSLDKDIAFLGEDIVITGQDFGATQPLNGYVTFENKTEQRISAAIVSWTDTEITVTVPANAVTGTIQVFNGITKSNELEIDLWKITQIRTGSSSSNRVDLNIDMELDSLDNAYVSHRAFSSGAYHYIRHLYYDGIDWVVNDPPESYHRAQYTTAIQLDSNQRVHLIYDHSSSGDLRYAMYTGSQWMIETIDNSSNNVGRYASFALDETDTLHIAYYDTTAGSLLYATGTAGSWTFETIDPAIGSDYPLDAGRCTVLIDGSNQVWVLYHGSSHLRAAVRSAPNNWVTSSVDTVTGAGKYIDGGCSAGGCTIVYYRYDSGGPSGVLYSATKTNGGSIWNRVPIDTTTSTDIGRYCAIDIGPDGIPFVYYYDEINATVRYAKREGTWSTFLLDDTRAGIRGSIQVTSENKPVIAYGADYHIYLTEQL
jgi:hypothetical protein